MSLFTPRTTFAQEGRPPAKVVVARVAATSQPASHSYVGSLVPLRKSVVGSAVAGRVVEVLVDEGDRVSMNALSADDLKTSLGQPMVRLRSVPLEIEIEAAQVELQLRRQAEEELQHTLPADIVAAEAAVQEIKARLKFSKDNYERLQVLAEQGAGIPEKEVAEAGATYRSQLQLSVVAEIGLKKLTTTQAIRLLQSQSRIEAQQAEIRRLLDQKERHTIRAPFAGYVVSKKTELGHWLAPGDDVMEIIQLDPIELVVNVPQANIQRLQAERDRCREFGRKFLAHVTVDSTAQLLEGEVVQIVPQADLRSRSFPVKIRIANPEVNGGHLLKSGMLARVNLFTGREKEVLLVKKDALVLGGPQVTLFVVTTDLQTKVSTVRLVPVEIGAAIDDWIEVTGELSQGDRVVVEGNERLTPGQPVQVASEMPVRSPDKPASPIEMISPN